MRRRPRLRPSALVAACLLGGCIITENPAYKTTAGADGTGDGGDTVTGPGSSGAEICPDGQPATAWYVDADRDGFGDDATEQLACDPPTGSVARPGDCVDDDPAINPDAEEICNGRDDNCNGDDDEILKCDGCSFALAEKYVYWACPLPADAPALSHLEARARCQTFSAKFAVDLVSVHSGEEHKLVADLAADRLGDLPGGIRAWIGLRKQDPFTNDCAKPDPVLPWQWTDNSAVDNTKWNKDQPSGASCDCGAPGCFPEACVELAVDPTDTKKIGWNDIECDSEAVRAYLCKTARDPALFPDP